MYVSMNQTPPPFGKLQLMLCFFVKMFWNGAVFENTEQGRRKYSKSVGVRVFRGTLITKTGNFLSYKRAYDTIPFQVDSLVIFG